MKNILLFVAVVSLFSCKTQTKMELDKTLPMVTKYADLENYKKKDIIAVGILSEEKFVNGEKK